VKRGILRSLFEGRLHRNLVNAAELKILHASSCEPDTIAIEAWDGDDIVFELVADCHGARSLWIGGREFDPDELLAVLSRSIAELDTWDAGLREPGAVWENEEKRAS
jgi:hypothetical protein